MPSAEDLIKKVISNNTVNVQIMTPELDKKLEDMEERQKEQHDESIDTQKKTKDEFAKISNQGSSNFKEGGEMINKGLKGLTGVDIGGKFSDLKDKVGDLGNIFKGFGKLLKFQGIAEGTGAFAEFKAVDIAKQELSVTEQLKKSIDKQNRLGEKERKSEVASRIQKEQPINVEKIKEDLSIVTSATSEELDAILTKDLGGAIKNFAEGKALSFDDEGNLSQDKQQRKAIKDEAYANLKESLGITEDMAEMLETSGFEDTLKDFLENSSRLAYELRSVDLNPDGQLVEDALNPNFGGFRLMDGGEFAENPKGILEGLNDKAGEELNDEKKQFKDLSDESKKTLLQTFGITDDFIDSYGDAQKAVDAISSNTVESVEVLRNTFSRSFDTPVQQENLQQELQQQQNFKSENVDDEQTQTMMDFLSNLPPILAVLQDQLDMDEDQKDKLFGGQKKTGSIVDKDGNPISSEDFKSPMGGFQDALKDGGRSLFDSVVQGAGFGAGSQAIQKKIGKSGDFGGQKPSNIPPKQPKGTTTPKGTAVRAGGGLLTGLRTAVTGFLGGAGGIATLVGLVVAGAGILGIEKRDSNIANTDEDKGEGDTDYAKRKKEELDLKRTELQGDETNFLGMQKITAKSIIDDNTYEGGQGFFDTVGNLLQGSSEIYFDKLNQDDALLRLDQLMAADDLIGDDLSKEDRKQLDQELRDAQTAAQKQLEDMQSETGERVTLEELGKYYDFEVLGENMLKNIQPPAMVTTDNSVINNSTTITSANPRQYDNDIDRAQGAAYT